MFTNLSPELAAARAQPDAVERFLRLVQTALDDGSLGKLLLSKYEGSEPQLERLTVREVSLRDERHLSFLWRYATRDVTKNHGLRDGVTLLRGLLDGTAFQNAHLHTATQEVQLAFSRKGRPSLRVGKVEGSAAAPAAAAGHDKEKTRYLDAQAPWWRELGLTHEHKGALTLVPAMSRKWKQINKFIEIFGAAFKSSPLASSPDVHVFDFGSGKGYLTFAMHEWISAQGKAAHVTGVELREDMVQLTNGIARGLNRDGLVFDQGDVRSYTPARLDVMIALHACDIATDYAIHLGLRGKASIIMCSPCCHKQLRPQMRLPAALKPMLQHGIHLGQEAEMVTDSLRALVLESEGYETQVFEFIALEHTSKNKMILAVKKQGAALAAAEKRKPEVLAQIAEIKRFYGIREQELESLLAC